MCLTTASKQLIAETDILVYKCLDHYPCICTPFQFLPIDFDNEGKCELGLPKNIFNNKECWDTIRNRRIYRIEEGFHSYYVEAEAKSLACQFGDTDKTRKHYAIIPKGSAYYIGTRHDIVSNRLVIFKCKKDFLAYKKENVVEKVDLNNMFI